MSRRGVVVAVLALTFAVLAGCAGTGSADSRSVTWWVLPDGVDARALAESCSAEGGYEIELRQLPADVDRQRTEIVRRLSAGDDSVDVLSLEGTLTAELAAAGWLAALPTDVEAAVTEGVLPKALEAATYDDEVVVAPWRLDPQLLWFRGTAAERAGLDTTQPILWDDLLAGAERLGATLQIDDPDGTGLADWVRGLVAGAGGAVIEGTGRDPEVGLGGEPARTAAGIVQFYAEAGIGDGPSADARTEFAGARGGFLLAGAAALTDPALTTLAPDMTAVGWPVVDAESIAPLDSTALAVPKASDATSLAFEAVTCLTTTEQQQAMMVGSGHGAARAAVYEAEEVKTAVRAAETMLEAATTGVTVPSTPYWQRVRAGIEETWSPIGAVSPSTTPAESHRAVTARVAGGLP